VLGCSQPAAKAWQPRPVFSDFGAIPHGRVATVRLALDLPTDRGPMVALGYQGTCTCASTQFIAVGKDGKERPLSGRPTPDQAILPGDQLFLELTIDTRRKEASELKPVTNGGEVWVTDLADEFGRIALPVSFTFGIAAPVHISPFAHIDFGALPMSRRYSVTLELRPREGGPVKFLQAQVDDARVTAAVRPQDDLCLLDVRVVPDPGLGLGAMRATIRVQTDMQDGYVVPIPVTGQIVSDIEVRPMERISFGRFDFTMAQEGSVLIRDYDTSRPAEFEVLQVRAVSGKDIAQHIKAELEPSGEDRGARLVLRYDGGFRQDRSFRGFVDLAKRGGGGSVVSIEFVGFSHD
jgi:hypothetical protein